MKPLDDLTPEEQQNEELVASLRQELNSSASISGEEQARHVARVRERLFQSKQTSIEDFALPLQSEMIASREQGADASLQEEHIHASPRRRSRFLHTVNMLAAVAVVCVLIGSALLIFAHHPVPTRTETPAPILPTTSPKITFAFVSFKPGTSYSQALRTITDLGLRLTAPCSGTELAPNGKIGSWFWWSPLAEGFPGNPPGMFIAPTPLASVDWLARLHAARGVTGIQTSNFVFYCPADHSGTPQPGATVALAPQQAGTYLGVTFSIQADSYDQALQAISNLGLRLADPCLERTGKRPGGGYSAGQEQKYAASRTLVLATTANSPNNWQKQLASLAGVQSVQVPAPVAC